MMTSEHSGCQQFRPCAGVRIRVDAERQQAYFSCRFGIKKEARSRRKKREQKCCSNLWSLPSRWL